MPSPEILKWPNIRHFLIGDADDAREFGGELNSFRVTMGANVVQFPNFGQAEMAREGGIVDPGINFQGYADVGEDFDKIGNHFYVCAPRGNGQQGADVVFADVVGAQFDQGAQVGEALTFTLDAPVNGWCSRGKVLRNAYLDLAGADASDSGPATGAEVQLSTVAAGQALYAAVFLLAFTGTSITFTIESDVTGFASPVSRIVLGPLTDVGAAFGSLVALITPDDHYRVVTTGTFTSATFIVVAAVGRA